MTGPDNEVFAAACRTSLTTFVHALHRRSIDKYVAKGYVDLLTAYLQDVMEIGGGRTVINMPPRHGKTTTVLATISWRLGLHPDKEYLLVTHNADLAKNLAGKLRNILEGEFYRSVFGQLQLEDGRSSLTRKIHGRLAGVDQAVEMT